MKHICRGTGAFIAREVDGNNPESLLAKGAGYMGMALHFAEVDFETWGVEANARQWARKKKPLIDRLSRHPKWNPDTLSIITQAEHLRTQSYSDRWAHMTDMIDIALSYARREGTEFAKDMTQEDVVTNLQLMNALLKGYLGYGNEDGVADRDSGKYRFLTERIEEDRLVSFIQEVLGFKRMQKGQKTSRLVQKMISSWLPSILSDESFRLNYGQWSESISATKELYTFCLSVNPADYMLMSHGHKWSSCQTIQPGLVPNGENYRGAYKAGAISYMNDAFSAIAYTVKQGEQADIDTPFSPKLNRQVCFISPESARVSLSRIYPAAQDSPFYDLFEKSVTEILSECFQLEAVTWESDHDIRIRQEDSMHYPDYDNFSSCIRHRKHKAVDSWSLSFHAGGSCYCLSCGDNLIRHESYLECEECNDDGYVCTECGDRGGENDMYLRPDEDGHLCDSCYNEYVVSCSYCGEDMWSDSDCVHRGADGDYYCEGCFYERFIYCHNCQEVTPLDEARAAEGDYYCEDCFDDAYGYCERCDSDAMPLDELSFDEEEGCYYCSDCMEDIEDERQAEKEEAEKEEEETKKKEGELVYG